MTPGGSGRCGPEDDDRLRALATARAHGETTVDDAEDVIRQLLDAVADTMTRPPGSAGGCDSAPPATAVRRPADPAGGRRGPRPARPGAARPADRGARGGAGRRRRGRRAPGARRGRRHPLRRRRAAVGRGRRASPHGFSRRARLSLSVALRRGRRGLDRRWTGCSASRSPTGWCSTPTSSPTCSSTGWRRSTTIGVDVFWPRGLRGELVPQGRVEVATGPREGQLIEGLFGPEAMFSFDWRLALAGDPLTDEEMSVARRGHLAGDPAARQLDGHRPGARPAGAQAGHRREAAGHAGGRAAGRADRHALPRRRRPRGAPRRHPGEGPRPDRRRRRGRAAGRPRRG